jgi:hypothetical protein
MEELMECAEDLPPVRAAGGSSISAADAMLTLLSARTAFSG